MSGQHSDYFGATPYYSPNLSSQSMSGYGTNVHSNNYPPQAQGSASSSQYTSSAYQVPTTPKQAPPRSSQHSTPQGRLPVPSKGSSSRGTSSSKYKPRQPHKCDDPSKRYTCKRKERSLLGFCQQGSCWNQQSPRSTHLCEKHLLQQRENKRNFRENHARENKCASCTADVVPGRTACEKHLEKRLEYIKKSRGVKETARTAKSQPKISDPQRTNYSQSQGGTFPQEHYKFGSNPQNRMGNDDIFTQPPQDYSFYTPQNQPYDPSQG